MMKNRLLLVATCLLSQSLLAGGNEVDHLKISGDPLIGKELYYRCYACHSLERNRTGPKHCGLIGRKAGSVEGYEYSSAMKQSKVVWTVKSLDDFLLSPLEFIPGTTMGFAGIENPQVRQNLIAYLAFSRDADECK